jgi:amino acid adenylation domain-containing protein
MMTGGFVEAGASTLPEVLRWAARTYGQRRALTQGARGGPVTYERLFDSVEGLAAELERLGVRPGGCVGLSIERGPATLLASAAVMRLGCAYVPLDPAYPAERLDRIASVADLTVVVADAAGARALGGTGLTLIEPELDFAGHAARGRAPDAPLPGPSDLAYVLFTSGSTGVPKGVAVTHDNVVALLEGMVPLVEIPDDDVWPLMHSYNFDVSVWEMWGGLATGATLVPVSSSQVVDPEALLETFLHHGVTTLNVVPGVFKNLAEALVDVDEGVALRRVLFGGEPLDYRAVRLWAKHAPTVPVWLNAYGITETTVHGTFHVLSPEEIDRGAAHRPIGRPLPHAPVALLDENLREVPVGEPGEMYVGGRQVAAGYLNQPDLTRERFVAVPGLPGRWYRSGDRARTDAQGWLHYIGRLDDQVKIRGFRIELGDVDAAVRRLPWVREAAAFVEVSPNGEPVLAAAVVFDTDPSGSDELRSRTRERLATILPAHMVPPKIVDVPELPKNVVGKTNRRALPDFVAGA